MNVPPLPISWLDLSFNLHQNIPVCERVRIFLMSMPRILVSLVGTAKFYFFCRTQLRQRNYIKLAVKRCVVTQGDRLNITLTVGQSKFLNCNALIEVGVK